MLRFQRAIHARRLSRAASVVKVNDRGAPPRVRGTGTARERDVFAAGGLGGLLERRFDSVGDEVEGGAALPRR